MNQLTVNQQQSIEITPDRYRPVIDLVLDTVKSKHSKRAYGRALRLFTDWIVTSGRAFDKASVNAYKAHMEAAGKQPAAINQALAAIRSLAVEAADNGYIDQQTAGAIKRVKGAKQEGQRLGNWLNKEDAQKLLNSPDVTTLKGLRDRALLAVALGGALRRSEIASLTYEHIRQVDGRWAIVDLVGKRGRVRSVPIASWVWVAISEWRTAVSWELETDKVIGGFIFLAINKAGVIRETGHIGPQSVYEIIDRYARQTGLNVAAHDLRRTHAKLAKEGGASIQQVQFTLGHSSAQTTERYLGTGQDFDFAPSDALGLKLSA